MRNVIILILSALLFGCASTEYLRDTRIAPASRAKFDRELTECSYQAKITVRRPRTVDRNSIMADWDMSQERHELIDQCMAMKGWTIK